MSSLNVTNIMFYLWPVSNTPTSRFECTWHRLKMGLLSLVQVSPGAPQLEISIWSASPLAWSLKTSPFSPQSTMRHALKWGSARSPQTWRHEPPGAFDDEKWQFSKWGADWATLRVGNTSKQITSYDGKLILWSTFFITVECLNKSDL